MSAGLWPRGVSRPNHSPNSSGASENPPARSIAIQCIAEALTSVSFPPSSIRQTPLPVSVKYTLPLSTAIPDPGCPSTRPAVKDASSNAAKKRRRYSRGMRGLRWGRAPVPGRWRVLGSYDSIMATVAAN